MSGECNCCVPPCPRPTIISEKKDSGPGSIRAYRTQNVGAILSFPASCLQYRGLRTHESFALSGTETRRTTASGSHPDGQAEVQDFIVREYSVSGSSELIERIRQPNSLLPVDDTAEGSSSFVLSDIHTGYVHDPVTGEVVSYTSHSLHRQKFFAGEGFELPGHQAGDRVGEADDFYVVETIFEQRPIFVSSIHSAWTGQFETLQDTTEYYFQGVRSLPILGNPRTTEEVKGMTSSVNTTTDPGGVLIRTDEVIEPWSIETLRPFFEEFVDSAPWTRGGTGNQSRALAIFQNVVQVDDEGDPVVDEEGRGVLVDPQFLCITGFDLQRHRYRLEIPHSFMPPNRPFGPILEEHDQRWQGVYQRIQVREVFTPQEHDPDDPLSPQKTVSIREIIWDSGGGLLINYPGFSSLSDEEQEMRRESWRTEWIDTGYPDERGTVEVSLVRSQCYRMGPWSNH